METDFVDSYLFSFKYFKEDAENAVSSFDSLFSGFSSSRSLSYLTVCDMINSFDGMKICKEDQIGVIIESIFINCAEKSNDKENRNKDMGVSAIFDKCSPEQKTILRSIETNVPGIIPELVGRYQYLCVYFFTNRNYLKDFEEPVSTHLPSLKIPIQYYEKQLPSQVSDCCEYINLIEIEMYIYR